MYPEDGPLNKPEGRLLEAPFGPIVSWYVRFTQAGAIPVAVTATGSYALSKPAQQYRRTHTSFEEQAALAWHVVQVSGHTRTHHTSPSRCCYQLLLGGGTHQPGGVLHPLTAIYMLLPRLPATTPCEVCHALVPSTPAPLPP